VEKTEYLKLSYLENSHWWYVGLTELVMSVLNEHQPLQRLLDAGCGTGGMLKLIQQGPTAIGIDNHEDAITFSRKKNLALLIRGSIEHLPFQSETFDCVVSLDVLYHSGVQNDESALSEFHRVMRKSGILILNLPAYAFLRSHHDIVIHTRRRYTKKILETKLAAAGFYPEKLTYRNFFLLPPILVWRTVQRFFVKSGKDSDLFQIPHLANTFLLTLLRLENWVIGRTDLPFGTSLFCVARK